MSMDDGAVAVLNVGAGDIRLSFDPTNMAERIRAKRIVQDMLRGGYALLVEVEKDGVKAFQRALSFDEERCEYIVADYDPTQGGLASARAEQIEKTHRDLGPPEPGLKDAIVEARTLCACGCGKPVKPGRKWVHGHHGRKRVPAEKTRAVAVSRSAGG